MLERSIELPLAPERFIARIEERIRFTGASRNNVIDASTRSMSHEKRDREAANAWKRNVLLEVPSDPGS
jgi:hypothetical protein